MNLILIKIIVALISITGMILVELVLLTSIFNIATKRKRIIFGEVGDKTVEVELKGKMYQRYTQYPFKNLEEYYLIKKMNNTQFKKYSLARKL